MFQSRLNSTHLMLQVYEGIVPMDSAVIEPNETAALMLVAAGNAIFQVKKHQRTFFIC